MRRFAAVFVGLLFAASVNAQTVTPVISSISPASIPVNTPEQFIDIYGANFYGGTQSYVTYTGPEGEFTLMASAGSGDHLQAYVPDAILLSEGTYSVVVTNDDGVNPPATSNAVTLTITGGPGPNIFVPESATAEATGPGGAIVHYEVTATSTSDPDVDVTCTFPSGSLFSVGQTTVTCTATDDQGQTATNDFVVAVVDTTPPALTLPEDITAEATSGSGAVVTFEATATDLVDGDVAVSCHPASGSTFPIGTTTVTCSAVDAHANSVQGTFDVTVADTTAPVITSITASPDVLSPVNNKLRPVTISVAASDAVDGSLTAQIVSVTANETIDATDYVVTGPLSLELRAERNGSADRIYTVTVAVSDDAGNTSTGTVTVRVGKR
ncbi:MAG TPA: HYR domain-containing protein [Thermoanaerobaculia bacterium]|nr:HYR domain-containing protein [Thermoanaerobaculia bacterium]